MGITFEDLQRVNKVITTVPIKGKEYAEVHQRIKAFRMLYPEGFIKTKIEKLEDGLCVCSASCGYYEKDEMGVAPITLGEGIAYEKENSSPINRTSYIENCSTSAIGRCLASAGIGIDTSICSADELESALDAQAAIKPITKAQVKSIVKLAESKGSDLSDICDYFKVGALDEMTAEEYGKCLNMLNAKR